ncbi:MAG: glycoside hydrolase family 15 protein [Bacillota bacterium]
MARHLVLGNGNLLLNFDESIYLRDLYYPYVGMENHIGGHHSAIGFWVNGQFSWLHSPEWTKDLGYKEQSLVGLIKATNRRLALEIQAEAAVHYRLNVFLLLLRLSNLGDSEQETRTFFYNDMYLGGNDVGNTALYDPQTQAMYHYKRNYYFLVNGRSRRGGIFQYNVQKRIQGLSGRSDAEDGWLNGNAIDQGSVDSSLSVRLFIPPGATEEVYFWITAGENLAEVRRLNDYVLEHGTGAMIRETETYWRNWVSSAGLPMYHLPREVARTASLSFLITRSQIDNRGGVLAANDTDILETNRDHYSYVWPRDGALVAYALDLAGFGDVTAAFFEFSARVITEGGYFQHKYNPDGTPGSSWHPWVEDGALQLPIQEDETGLVVWALWEHYRRHRKFEHLARLYPVLVKPAADFMSEYRDPLTGLPMESYDLWEERRGIFTFTTSTVYAGLNSAANIAALLGDERSEYTWRRAALEVKQALLRYLFSPELGRFLRGLRRDPNGRLVADSTLDASLWGVVGLGVLEPASPQVEGTMQSIVRDLWVKTEVGGVARYVNDFYFKQSDDPVNVPGNPWIICTLWVADWYVKKAQTEADLAQALDILEWVCRHRMSTGLLSEQLHPYTGEPLSVAPLTWSHATFCQVVVGYLKKLAAFRKECPPCSSNDFFKQQ